MLETTIKVGGMSCQGLRQERDRRAAGTARCRRCRGFA